MELLSFIITVILGVISLALGIFAIWMSRHFDARSTAALNAIRDLAAEIRMLTDVEVTQQKDFSLKMLDSILSRDQYGQLRDKSREGDVTLYESMMQQAMRDAEKRIAASMENRLQEFTAAGSNPKDFETSLNELRNQIREITAMTVSPPPSSLGLPGEAKTRLEEWKDYPAHFVILGAVMKENAHSREDLTKVHEKYSLPGDWESGLRNLLKSGILAGDESKFAVAEGLQNPLSNWLDGNWSIIEELMAVYKRMGQWEWDREVRETERTLGAKVRF